MMQAEALHNKTIKTTCCYCGVGCGMLVDTVSVNGKISIQSVRGDPEHPANFGRLCTKGSSLHLTAQEHVYQQTRAKYPEWREQKEDARVETSWDHACDHVSTRLADIIAEHGPDAVAFYVSGQLLTEDYYVFNKLAKGLIGTNNIDTNSRLCMSSAVAGYKRSLGADAPPCQYEDIDHASVIFISGSNTAYAHPILFRRIEAAKEKNPQLKIIVVDPRETDTATSADLFLQISPGTDVALYHGMLHIMLWEGWIDHAFIDLHTSGFNDLKSLVKDYAPKAVAEICGIAEPLLFEAARLFATSTATLSLYCQGLNQSSSGTAKNSALINLHLATGQIGKAGAGPFSLTGQPNAMGGREVGGLANQLAAHRDLANPAHREEVAQFWGVSEIAEKPGLTAIPLFEALRAGKVKAVWIVCTNPAQSLPDQTLVHQALSLAEFVVVQDAYANTATTAYADVLLPATTWAEKIGTVTNSERRISRVNAALPAYGQCRHDWLIAADIARRLESKLPVERRLRADSLFAFESPEAVWNEHRALTKDQDLDITGLSYEILGRAGPQQWPYPTGATQGKARLYEDHQFATNDRRARFIAEPYRATAERPSPRFPISLTTGRLRDQWHGMSRTGTIPRLFAHAPQPCIELSPSEGRRLALHDGDLVYVTSARGVQVLPVCLSKSVRSSQAFIAMHWGSEFVSGHGGRSISYGVNSLTHPALDPISEQPEFKFTAIRVTKANFPWHLKAFGWFDESVALRKQQALRALFDQTTYASCVLFGRDDERRQTGLHLTLASIVNFDASLVKKIIDIFGLRELQAGESTLNYADSRQEIKRYIHTLRHEKSVRVHKVFMTGAAKDLVSTSWLLDYLEQATDVSALGRALLAPKPNPPLALAPRGRIICNCLNVSETSILNCLNTVSDRDHTQVLATLQSALGCGTQCGSCVPEIKQIVAQHGHQ